ncbi:MAG TPA: creatininase family protein, partial [Bacillota bacterium]|nr:creatininase family protein [Bacillota bacterium]
MEEQKWILTERPEVIFENTSVGRMKKQVWDASVEEIDAILNEYGVGAPSELGKAGTYIQNTP